MLVEQMSDNLEDNILITSLGYLFTSKAINQHPTDTYRVSQRLLLMNIGFDYFKYSVAHAIDITKGGLRNLNEDTRLTYATLDVHRMEFSDLENHPETYSSDEMHDERRTYIYEIAKEGLFNNETSGYELLESGIKNHKIVYEYLDKKILKQGEIVNPDLSSIKSITTELSEFIELAKMSREEMTVKLDWLPEQKLNSYRKFVNQFQSGQGDDSKTLRHDLNQQQINNISNSIRIIDITRKY